MTKDERIDRLRSMEDTIVRCMDELVHVRNWMEEMRMKSTAKKLDTVVGKLYDLSYEVEERRKTDEKG